MVVTQGDETSELVKRYRLGIVTDYEDADGVAKAVLELLDTPIEGFQERFENARQELTWEKAAQPLVRFCHHPRHAPDKRALKNRLGNPYYLTKINQIEEELSWLRSLVKGYEQGKFIRFMKKIHQWKSNMKARLGRA
jgi:hypothetical protein